MGDRNPKEKQKMKKQHQQEMARKQAERQSHTHRFAPDAGGPNQNAQGNHNDQHHHKKAG